MRTKKGKNGIWYRLFNNGDLTVEQEQIEIPAALKHLSVRWLEALRRLEESLTEDGGLDAAICFRRECVNTNRQLWEHMGEFYEQTKVGKWQAFHEEGVVRRIE